MLKPTINAPELFRKPRRENPSLLSAARASDVTWGQGFGPAAELRLGGRFVILAPLIDHPGAHNV